MNAKAAGLLKLEGLGNEEKLLTYEDKTCKELPNKKEIK